MKILMTILLIMFLSCSKNTVDGNFRTYASTNESFIYDVGKFTLPAKHTRYHNSACYYKYDYDSGSPYLSPIGCIVMK